LFLAIRYRRWLAMCCGRQSIRAPVSVHLEAFNHVLLEGCGHSGVFSSSMTPRHCFAADRFEIDWEPPNEEWERVLYGPSVLGLVCARIPLGIVRAGDSPLDYDDLSLQDLWYATVT